MDSGKKYNIFGDFYNATNVTDFWRRWNPSMVRTIRHVYFKLRRRPLWPLLFSIFLINGMLHDLLIAYIPVGLITGHFPKVPVFTIVFVVAFFTIYLERMTGINKLKHPLGRVYVLGWWVTLVSFIGWLL